MNKLHCAALMLSVACCLPVFGNEPELIKVGGKGKVAVVDTCNAPSAALGIAKQKIGDLMMIEFETQKGEWRLSDAKKCFEATKANAAVFIVKDKSLPLSLIALEEKWGVVNAEGLNEDQLAKETLRVATVVLGGATSKYPASSMRPVFSKDDLSKKAGNIVTFDSIIAISNYLSDLGIEPFQMMTREDAIAEGLVKGEKSPAKK